MTDWATIRKFAVGRHEPPDNWPTNVKPISQEGLALLGIDPATNELFWDGQKLVTEKRWSNTERVIAWTGVVLAAVGVGATVVQAWFAAFPPVAL